MSPSGSKSASTVAIASRCNFLLAAALLCLGACTPVVDRQAVSAQPMPDDFPVAFYEQAARQGLPVYRVDGERSVAEVRVRRGGKLAHLGHDHLVAARDIAGYLLWTANGKGRRADLFLALDSLEVDDPALRRKHGLEATISQGDIDKTRENMLHRTLDVNRYPFAMLHIRPLRGTGTAMTLAVEISLNGVRRTETVALAAREEGPDLRFNGRFSLRQSDYGIVPFSALGGLLQVEDRLDIDFEIVASRLAP